MRLLRPTAGTASPATGYTVPIDPEHYKLATLDLLDDAGVRYLFHALAEFGRLGDRRSDRLHGRQVEFAAGHDEHAVALRPDIDAERLW